MRIVFVAVLATIMVSTACGTNKWGFPEPPPADQWVTTKDPDTGHSFALPDEPKSQHQDGSADGTRPAQTVYVVEHFGLLMMVTFTESPEADYSKEGLDFVANSTVESHESILADDVELTNKEHTTIGDHPALDFRLSFTDQAGKRGIKFSRYIGDGTRAVLLQSTLSVAAENEATAVPIVEKYHRHLVDSVHLS